MPFAPTFADRTKVLLDHVPAAYESIPAVASEPILAAVTAALDRGETHYTDRPGILPLREKVAASLALRFNVKTRPENDVIVTCGVTEARFITIQQLLKPGDTLAAPLLADRIAGAALLRRVTLARDVDPSVHLVYLTSSTPAADVQRHLASAPETALILFEIDDSDSRFHPAQLAGFAERTVTIGDLGAASWRTGYLASPGSFAARLRDFKQALTICSTNLSQWAALAATEAR